MGRGRSPDVRVSDELFSHRTVAWLLLESYAAMASPARRLDLVPPAPADDCAELAARLAQVEAEAAALRDEVAALRDDLATLAGVEDNETETAPVSGGVFSRGWLAAGWARASLVLASLGLVMMVSVPYLMHLLGPADADPLPGITVTAPRFDEPSAARAEAAAVEAAPTETVAPARLGHPAPPKARAAVSRSRARATAPAAEPAPAALESR